MSTFPDLDISGGAGSSFMCPIEGCGKIFARKFNLKTHLNTHDPERARPFQCPDCEKTFVRFHDLDRHQTVHSKTKEFRCECGVSFTRKVNLTSWIEA
ncbi:hypothetical protein DFJ73DRAFT_620011 [Zopfochytrium polystomum]|nr:hypothetical protein DFJ73DRAFT_620011 [Zopfochytrium polystomum]